MGAEEVLSRSVESGRLRVDARRNLESVLRAAREVFGELGYDAPMEEVARRAGVGVGTVYRRFPSKEVLVRRIAAEEVTWLTAQAREALAAAREPWDALAGYLSRAVGSGAGRLLPPEAFRHAEELTRVPAQRGPQEPPPLADEADPAVLLRLLGELVERARAAGELRPWVTVADVVLVLTAAVPAYAAPAPRSPGLPYGAADGVVPHAVVPPVDASGRLLRILLEGLRAGDAPR